jgi:decaprenyl-diphosphate synthase subunit 2
LKYSFNNLIIQLTVHDGMINFQPLNKVGKAFDSDSYLFLGNKLSLLGGDYLLGTVSVQIALLRNHYLNYLIPSALRDMAELRFISDSDEQNNPLPFDPTISAKYKKLETPSKDFEQSDEIDNLKPITIQNFMECPEKEWTLRNILKSASLLGKSCQGAMLLAENSERMQKLGYLFGKYMALSWQAWLDLEVYKLDSVPEDSSFSLVSAPILFHLDHDPTLYREIIKGKKSVKNVNYQKVHEIVRAGPGIEKTKELQEKYNIVALTALKEFPECDAKEVLKNIIYFTNPK